MKRKKNHSDDQPGRNARAVPDFLPPPHELVLPRMKTKVTILLDKESVAFFKAQAKRHGAKYQQMMRSVLSNYAHQYRDTPNSSRPTGV